MPWYWTDDLARVLVERGVMEATRAAEIARVPVALRLDHEQMEDAAGELADDDEIPLAA